MRFLAMIAALALAAPLIFAKSKGASMEAYEGDARAELEFEFDVTEDDFERRRPGQGKDHKKPPHKECKGVCSRPRRLETMHGDTEYFVFENCKRFIKREEARHACRKIGGKLADVPSKHVFHYLADRIDMPCYVNSWETNTYGGACLALYPPTAVGEVGAMAVPVGGCEGARGFICEVKVGECPYVKKDQRKSVSAAGCLNI